MSTTFPDHLKRLEEDLDQAWSRLYGSTSRRRQGIRWVRPGIGLALATGFAVALWTIIGGSGPSIVERAIAAVNDYPSGLIVHRVDQIVEPSGKVIRQQESWVATSPPYAQRVVTYWNGKTVEQGARGDEISSYDPATNTVYVRTVPGGTAEGTLAPDTIAGTRHVAEVLKLGGARDDGPVTTSGQTVRRITVSGDAGICTYDVDPETYLGLRWACSDKTGATSVETWDYAARTSQSDASVSLISQHPAARVDRGPVKPCPAKVGTSNPTFPPCIVYSHGG